MPARNAAPKRVGIASAIPQAEVGERRALVGPRQPEPHLAPAERAGPDDDERHDRRATIPAEIRTEARTVAGPSGRKLSAPRPKPTTSVRRKAATKTSDGRRAGVRRAVSAALERLGAGAGDKAQPDRGKPDDEGDSGAGTPSRGDGHEDRTEARDAETPGHEVEAGGRASVELEDAAPRSRRATRLEEGARDSVGGQRVGRRRVGRQRRRARA